MKIPHIKLEIRILFHWLHLSGKLCHQVREGKRLVLAEIIILSSTQPEQGEDCWAGMCSS